MIIFNYIGRLILSMLLGGLIGIDREKAEKSAGLRTCMLTSMACTMATLVPSLILKTDVMFDFSRIMAGVLTGIGFLGAGVIMKGRRGLEGVTTAALIFAVAVLGMVIGLGECIIGAIYAVLIFGILKFKHLEDKIWK